MSVTDDERDTGVVDLLIETGSVRVWRVGTDYDIECQPGWSDEDFDAAIYGLGLEGRSDYELSYIPETGMEIFRLPMLSVPEQRQRGLGWVKALVTLGFTAGAVVTAALGRGGGWFRVLMAATNHPVA